MKLKMSIILICISLIVFLSGCSSSPKCGDNQCDVSERNYRLNSYIAECSPNHCFQDCGTCYIAKTDEFVAKRTAEQYKILQTFNSPFDAACLAENDIRNRKTGDCKSTSVSQDNNGDYLISCKCKWDDEHRYSLTS